MPLGSSTVSLCWNQRCTPSFEDLAGIRGAESSADAENPRNKCSQYMVQPKYGKAESFQASRLEAITVRLEAISFQASRGQEHVSVCLPCPGLDLDPQRYQRQTGFSVESNLVEPSAGLTKGCFAC